jgi:hypothetical protein
MSLFDDAARRKNARQAEESEWERTNRLRLEAEARERAAVAEGHAAIAAAKAARVSFDVLGLRLTPTDFGISASFAESGVKIGDARKVIECLYEAAQAAAEGRPAAWSRGAQEEKARREAAARAAAEASKAEQEAEAAKEAELKNAERLVREYDAAKALLKSKGGK